MTSRSGSIALLAAWGYAASSAAQPAEPAPGCDAEWATLAAAAGTTDDHDGADGVVVFDRSAVRVEASGRAHLVRARLQKALTEAGVAALAVQRFDYDPATSLLEIRRAVRVRADGRCEPVPVDGAEDLPQPAGTIYWDLRMKLLPVPRPEVGDLLYTETYFTGFQIAYLDAEAPGGEATRDRYAPPMYGHFYDTVLFGDEPWPVLEKSYAVELPRDKPLQYESYGPPVSVSSGFDEQTLRYVFRAENLPAAAHDPGAPASSDYLSKVVMATVPGWPDKSRWFFQANEPQFVPGPDVQAAAERITAGLRSDEERVAALNSWVAHQVRYRGFSLGPEEGYTMHPGDLTFEHRAGVCKDKAGMLVTLMRALGFEVYPAMTMAGARVERIAADQFNHAVVAWRQPDGSFRMVDPTWAPFSRDLWSRAETEQHYLVGTAEGEELAITPAEGPERNGVSVTARSRLLADGTLEGNVRLAPVGFVEDRLRRAVGRASALETRAGVEDIAVRLAPSAEVPVFRFVDPFALDGPFTLEFTFRAPGHAAADPDAIRFRFGALRHPFGPGRLGDFLAATEADERETPILLRSPQTVTAEERVTLPDGFDLAATDEQTLDTGIAAFEGRVVQEGRSAVATARLEIRRRNVPVGEYGDLKRAVDALRDFADREWLLVRPVRREGGAR